MTTASSLPRLFGCVGHVALPHARTTSEWSEAGTDRHSEQEAAIVAGDLDTMPAKVRALIPADATSIRAEVAVAYDVATGLARELGCSIGRAYEGLAPFEIPGTVDMVALAPGRALVVDWKSFEDVGPPEQNPQALFYALCFARIHGADEVTVAISYLGAGGTRHATLDSFELETFAQRLQRVYGEAAEQKARVASGRLPDVSEGPWCKHCPAIASCPAKVALLRRIVTGQEADDLAMMFPLDAETARAAYERLQSGKNLLRRVERALYAYAHETPIDLGGGRYFGKHTKKGHEKLDGDTVWGVVAESYGRDVADMAVIRSATKKRLGDVLKQHGGKGADRMVLDEVRRRGGASRDEKEDVGEFTATELTEGTP